MTDRITAAALHPDLRALRFAPHIPVRTGWQRRALRAATRLLPAPVPPDGVASRGVDLGEWVSLVVAVPNAPTPRGALLWVHGGGMVIGTARQDLARCFHIARNLGIVVVAVEYRLAPEHPFPVPLDDCHRAWTWLLERSDDLDVDTGRLAIGGQSAGGGLAAGLVQRLHDEGGVQPVAQWLFSPMLDDRTAADRSLDAVRHYIWDNRANRAGWSSYLGGAPGRSQAPSYAAPARRDDLAGLPAAWIGTSTIELFHAEDRDYAERLAAFGVPCVLDEVAGAPHGFESIATRTDLVKGYWRRATSWLGGRLRA
ncbi:alpha/beta hydrolase [Nigerium massiliense]|uniref:alpha/beta hydrolase n=1 Tax=Nigerium massiliense TaxID=1522317 RepID=UPI00058C7F41|nr:alpha/beta hydrolase [Nigerium massiliense]